MIQATHPTTVAENAEILAQVRSETAEEVRRRFSDGELAKLPRLKRKYWEAIHRAQIEATGVEGDYAWARLPNGRTLWGYLTSPTQRRAYRLLHDKLPDCVTEDAFLTAMEAAIRYDRTKRREKPLPIREGGNIVELGAYLGHRSIGLVDAYCGERGGLIAVEMMPNNVALLRRNIAQNGLDKRINVQPFGISDHAGIATVITKGRQRSSLAGLEKLAGGEQSEVPVRTFDDMADEWGIEEIDFVYMTVNGAELQVLQGMNRWVKRVRAIRIASYFDQELANREVARIEELGFYVTKRSKGGLIFAEKESV